MAKRTLADYLELSPAGLSRGDRRNAVRLLQDNRRAYENMLAADQMSGVGFPIDTQVRRILKMINQDALQGLDVPLPKLIDVAGAFYKLNQTQIVPIYCMREELDHAFDPADFFAYATDEGLKAQTIPALQDLKEGVIHNFTALNDVRTVQFQSDEGEPIVLSGIAMIRLGNLLFWQTAGGVITDLAKITADRRAELAANEERIRASNPQASEKMLESILRPAAEALPGTTDIWNCSAYGLFNLNTLKHEMRMTSKEWTVSQAVFSDQFETKYADLYEKDEGIRRMVDKSVAQIEKDHMFFELAETAFTLPAYFKARVEFLGERQVTTKLGDQNGGQARKHALKAPLPMRILTRRVATLDFRSEATGGKSYTPPRYQVEVGGFYRRLPDGSTGKDSEGNPVKGMTWVKGHARWKEKPQKRGTVHVKTAISTAMDKATAMVRKFGGEVRFNPRG